jgi:flagellar hook protein FlgE
VLGLGSTLNGLQRANTQGTITATGKATDVAINGNGFFVVDTGSGYGFTRAGNFQLDKNGNLVCGDGFSVMGFMATNGVIDPAADLTPITISIGDMVLAQATTSISVKANLDCRAEVDTEFAAPVTFYDSLGDAHTVTIHFTRTDAGWSWTASIPAVDVGGGATDDRVEIGSGDITFDETGRVASPVENPALSITGFSNGASDMDVEFGMIDEYGLSSITGLASESSVSKTTQNGVASSFLTSISFDSTGVVRGTTAGGQSIALAQLALASFPNVDGLQKYKGNTFIKFANSGEPSIGLAGVGGRGSIVGGSLEQSNVDMAQEFVNLIAAQRAYQANSRVITTTDELYADSLNLKR